MRHHGGVRALLASITCEKGDLEGNLARHCDVIVQAGRAGCDVAVFPEFSLTGSVDPVDHPERAITLDDPHIERLAGAAHEVGVGALFGFAEACRGEFFITQAYAIGGRVDDVQRKRRLGDDERGFAIGSETALFAGGDTTFGTMICAEANADSLWDATAATGAPIAFYCSAPGLYERRATEGQWRDGFEWWGEAGLANARRQARRLALWVGMATQAGSTIDEDFPGIAALIDPDGEIVDRLPDWRPGTLVAEIPIT